METAKSIAESLGVGKTQIQSIFFDKEKIIETWKQGVCDSNRKYIKSRNCAFKDVNELVGSGSRLRGLRKFQSLAG